MSLPQSLPVQMPLPPVQSIERQAQIVEIRPASVDKSKRIEFLDVLRGIAAFAVLCDHSLETVSTSFAHFSTKYLNLGEVGVVVFFIVSGFIIPVSIEKYNSLPRFWLGRVLRLWPTYLASLLAAVVLNKMNVLGTYQSDYYNLHPARYILGNMTMFAEYLRIPLAIGAYWTLALELFFYILCSVLFVFGVLGRTRIWLWLSIAMILLSQVAFALAFHQSLPAGRLGLIVTAFFGTFLYRQRSEGVWPRTSLLVLPALFAVFAITFWIRFHLYVPPVVLGPPRPTAWCAIASWISAYLIFLTAYALRSMQLPRIFIWLGQISYPLYLFHGLVLAATPASLPWPVFLLVTLAGSLLVAHLTHVLIEKPVAKFQSRVLPRKPIAA